MGVEVRMKMSPLQAGKLYMQHQELMVEVSRLRVEVERLEQEVCSDCLEYEDDGTPATSYGWNENRVEGQIPCGCISESGPYQEVLNVLREIKAGGYPVDVEGCPDPLQDRIDKILA